jgi:hypothetical protein
MKISIRALELAQIGLDENLYKSLGVGPDSGSAL